MAWLCCCRVSLGERLHRASLGLCQIVVKGQDFVLCLFFIYKFYRLCQTAPAEMRMSLNVLLLLLLLLLVCVSVVPFKQGGTSPSLSRSLQRLVRLFSYISNEGGSHPGAFRCYLCLHQHNYLTRASAAELILSYCLHRWLIHGRVFTCVRQHDGQIRVWILSSHLCQCLVCESICVIFEFMCFTSHRQTASG